MLGQAEKCELGGRRPGQLANLPRCQLGDKHPQAWQSPTFDETNEVPREKRAGWFNFDLYEAGTLQENATSQQVATVEGQANHSPAGKFGGSLSVTAGDRTYFTTTLDCSDGMVVAQRLCRCVVATHFSYRGCAQGSWNLRRNDQGCLWFEAASDGQDVRNQYETVNSGSFRQRNEGIQVAVTQTEKDLNLFLNGQRIEKVSYGADPQTPASLREMRLDKICLGDSRVGRIDDFSVWVVALSPAEILEIIQGGIGALKQTGNE